MRGLVLRAIDDYVTSKSSPAERQRLLDELPPEHARDFSYGTLQAIVFYDLEMLTRYLELATSQLFGDDPGWGREAGAAAVSGEVLQILRPALRPDRPLAILRRASPLCSRWFDFGLWEASQEAEKLVTLRITDLDPASQPLRLWLVGLIEGVLRATHPGADVAIARGEAAFSPQLVLDVSMR